jgi:hypothetical protein
LVGIFSFFRLAPRESGNYGRATNAFLSIAPARSSDTSAKKFDGDDKGHYTMREIRDGRAIPTMLFLCSDEEARGFEWGV